MSLRPYVEILRNADLLIDIKEKVKQKYEITEYLQKNQNKAVMFHNVEGSTFPLLGNSLSSRDQLKFALKEKDKPYEFFQKAILNPIKPNMGEDSLTFSNKEKADLSKLPIPKFFQVDGGKYLTSAIVFAKFPETDISNMSIHRIMMLNDQKGTVRIVPRDLFQIYNENKERDLDTPIAIVNGYHPILGLAASTPTPKNQSELYTANALMRGELSTVQTPMYKITIPKDVEFVLEGRILADEETEEGPFVDITGTPDDIRVQPIIQFETMFYRDNAIFQTILPAYEEHFIMMGYPREAAIHNSVSKVVSKVHGVFLTPSGCGWLSAIISVTTESDIDGQKVGFTAFEAHPSLKWVTVVDEDIDIFDSKAVEWARITRAGTNDITILENMRGSSLDPSRRREDNTSIKIIIDATKKRDKSGYERTIPF